MLYLYGRKRSGHRQRAMVRGSRSNAFGADEFFTNWNIIAIYTIITTHNCTNAVERKIRDDETTLKCILLGLDQNLPCLVLITHRRGVMTVWVYLAAYQFCTHLASTVRSTFRMLVP
jgi:hypothetical protein